MFSRRKPKIKRLLRLFIQRRILVLVAILSMGIHVCAYAMYQKPTVFTAIPADNSPKTTAPIESKEIDLPTLLATHNIHSIEEYANWLKENIQYKLDENGDSWAKPLETLKKGYGDCEDLAFLNKAVLNHFGYATRVLAHEKEGYAHAFTLFSKDGVYHVFDNTDYHVTNARSIKDIVLHFIKKEKSQFLIELHQSPGNISVIYVDKSFQG